MRSNEQLKKEVMSFFQAGLDAVDPYNAVKDYLCIDGGSIVVGQRDGVAPIVYDSRLIDRIIVVGAGKATARMAQAVEEILGDRLSAGLIVVKTGYTASLESVKAVEASHPVPDEAGVRGVREMLDLVDGLDERTLVVALISGGGSALLPQPAEGISLKDKQEMTDLLLAAGADIKQMNTIRKHISGVKGGNLARRAFPAKIVSLILSDVVGDVLDTIASGPTVPDATTFRDAAEVLETFELWSKAPASIAERIRRGCDGELEETPKPGDPVFESCDNVLIGTNRIALHHCAEAARAAGWNTLLLSSLIEGETQDVARVHAAIAHEIRRTSSPLSPPACIVSGGETTVTIRGDGLGGRNQEFALATAFDIEGEPGMTIFSAGTDGTDGPTDAAGAIAFGDTISRARERGFSAREVLRNNDSYHLFEAVGDLIKTGPTNTNVMDVHLVLVDR